MEVFWSGMRIVGVILQIAGVFAAAICGLVLVISAVCFVVGGVLKFWFDADKEDGESGAERCWRNIWDRQGWSKEGEESMDGGVYYPPPPPPAQNTSANLCVCRSCPECDTAKAGRCPARKCEKCEPERVVVKDGICESDKLLLEHIKKTGTIHLKDER